MIMLCFFLGGWGGGWDTCKIVAKQIFKQDSEYILVSQYVGSITVHIEQASNCNLNSRHIDFYPPHPTPKPFLF